MKKYMLCMALAAFLFCCGFSFQNTTAGYIKEDTEVGGVSWKQYTEVYVFGKNEKTASVYYMGALYELPSENIASLEEIWPELASSGKKIKEMTLFLTAKKDTTVYIQPETSQKALGVLREGQPAIATAKPAGGWIQIYYIGTIGYIRENTAEFYLAQPLPTQEKAPLKKGIKINVLGDSISYGDRLKEQSSAYPYLLAGRADAAGLNNYSICATCIAGLNQHRFVERYPEMDRNADVVLVFGGTNDYGVLKGTDMGNFGDISDKTFYGGLNLMMCGLKQMYPDGEIVFMTPLRRAGDKNPNAKGYTLKQYALAIQKMGDFWGIRVIDAYSAPELNFAAKTSYLVDGLHPGEAGHTLLGNFLYQELFEQTKE